jgi:two-component system, LytTR family, sensor histidine kinase AgrC
MREKLNFKKILLTSTVIGFVQAAAIIVIIIYNLIIRERSNHQWNLEIEDIILLIAIGTVFISSFITIKNLFSVSFISNEQGAMKSTLEQLEGLNKTLRAQRHDFINHLQVVYSLMEMTEFDEARNYIEKVYEDIQKINGVMKTSNPAVNALLQAKLIYCEKKNIEMKLNITTGLEMLAIPSWEFCRVLANIIDNAIYALEEKSQYKYIRIEIFENMRNYGFKISNNGPQIPIEIINKIFIGGFSTKGDNGEGMGLAITKDIISRYNGDIKVSSNDICTFFEGFIPKQ